MKNKKAQLLDLQMNAEESNKQNLTSENVTENERVEDTPFTLLKTEVS